MTDRLEQSLRRADNLTESVVPTAAEIKADDVHSIPALEVLIPAGVRNETWKPVFSSSTDELSDGVVSVFDAGGK
jgi:hypothetical protein